MKPYRVSIRSTEQEVTKKVKYNVYVYRLAEEGEIEIDASSEEEAKHIALRMAKDEEVPLHFPIRRFLAIPFLAE